jgi:hypothetical protein
MGLDFDIFDSERLITKMEKRPALYKLITIWVCDLSASMHLGLVNGSFVPYNLISAQCSPVLC